VLLGIVRDPKGDWRWKGSTAVEGQVTRTGAFIVPNAIYSPISAPASQRQHVAFVVQVDPVVTRLFVDGREQGRIDAERLIAPNQLLPGQIGTSRERAPQGRFRGVIDEARVSSVARYTQDFTPAERFEADAHTELLYHFDEGQGEIARDASGHGRDGKITGAVWVKQIGPQSWEPYDPDRRAAEWALGIGGDVVVTWPQTATTYQTLRTRSANQLPSVPFRLVSIDLKGNQSVRDEDLARLRGLESLDYLILSQTQIRGHGFVHLQSLPRLRGLWLQLVGVDDAALVHLRGLPLKQLPIATMGRITDVGLSHLDELNLESLALDGVQITDEGLQRFRWDRHESLLSLMLGSHSVTDDGVRAVVQGAPQLKALRLALSKLTDRGVAEVAGLRQLERLDLQFGALTDEGIHQLAALQNLQTLSLQLQPQVTEAGIARLKQSLPKCEITWRPFADADRRVAELVLRKGGSCIVTVEGQGQREVKPLEELPSEHFVVNNVMWGAPEITVEDLSVLREASRLGILQLGPIALSDQVFQEIAKIGTLRHLWLSGSTFSDESLRDLQALPTLHGLVLSDTAVGDAGIAALSPRTPLMSLNLTRTRVTDAAASDIKQLQTLRSLNLGETRFTAQGIAELRQALPQCHVFWNDNASEAAAYETVRQILLSQATVTVRGKDGEATVRKIEDVPPGAYDVVELVLDRSPVVNDAYLEPAKLHPNLRALSLRETAVTDAGLKHLTVLANLRRLDVSGTRITPAGIAELQKALSACKIEWDGGVIEPKPSADPDRRAAEWLLSIGIKALLRGVDGKVEIGRRGNIQAAKDLPTDTFQIGTIDLGFNPQLTDAGLEHLKGLLHLGRLFLNDTAVSDDGLVHLKGLANLWLLYLQRTRVTDAGLEHLKGLTKLTTLWLNETPVSDAGLQHLKVLANLKTLKLDGTQVTDAGLQHLKGLISLRELHLTGTKVTALGVATLQQTLPNCRIVWEADSTTAKP
jgi:Leucine-rich repeat (LRR) protein